MLIFNRTTWKPLTGSPELASYAAHPILSLPSEHGFSQRRIMRSRIERGFNDNHRAASEGLGVRHGVFRFIAFVQSHNGNGRYVRLLNTSETSLHYGTELCEDARGLQNYGAMWATIGLGSFTEDIFNDFYLKTTPNNKPKP